MHSPFELQTRQVSVESTPRQDWRGKQLYLVPCINSTWWSAGSTLTSVTACMTACITACRTACVKACMTAYLMIGRKQSTLRLGHILLVAGCVCIEGNTDRKDWKWKTGLLSRIVYHNSWSQPIFPHVLLTTPLPGCRRDQLWLRGFLQTDEVLIR